MGTDRRNLKLIRILAADIKRIIMETLLILLILVVWISLYSHISKMNAHADALRKDLSDLRKSIEVQLEELRKLQTTVASDNKERRAEEAIPVTGEKEEKKPVKLVEPVVELRKKDGKVVAEPVIKPFGIVKEKKKTDVEKYIGENLFGKIGILVLVVGMGLFVKYAIDKNWINEVFRTILGFVVGGGLLLLSQRLKKEYRTFSSLLAGGAFAIFYVTVGMAYHYYGLFSQTAAFIILVVLTVLMSLLSVLYNRRELAIIALTGGFIAPFLVSNGMGNYLVLFTYLTILNMGMFGLSLYKKWGELSVICFAATYLIMLGYSMVADLDIAANAKLVHLLLFSTLYYLIFLLPVVSVLRTENKKINQLLVAVVVLNNFFYLYFALWYLGELQLPYNIKGAITLFIALINAVIAFAVRKRRADKGILFTLLTGMFLTFISISIPIQLDGTFITLLWATEMVVVVWAFSRFRQPVYAYCAWVLVFLTVVSYLTDLEIAIRNGEVDILLLNGPFATGIFTTLAFGAVGGLTEWRKAFFKTSSVLPYRPFNAIAWLTGCAVLYLTFIVDVYRNINYNPLLKSASLVFTCFFLFFMLIGLHRRFPVGRHSLLYAIALGVSDGLYVWLSWIVNKYENPTLRLLLWGTFIVVVIHFFYLAKYYYSAFDFRLKSSSRMSLFLAIGFTILLVVYVNNLLYLVGWEEESRAALSISLTMAGFIQMALGMRLHMKVLRMLSLAVFGVVLLKLVVVDLWLLPTIGKIIVFILLGIILLVLSFLYQKLKKVLFTDNREA